MANNFLQFCPTDTGTNLPTQVEYAADADRTSGNKPGVASSKLNNKALRQANFITSQVAQMVADKTGADILDDGVSARILAQLNGALLPFAPKVTRYTSGTAQTHNITYLFMIATGSATIAATYTNNGNTYTVTETVAGGVVLKASGPGAPAVSGTLTKSGGTGDTTITFYAVRAPIALEVKAMGGGAGAWGSGSVTGATPTAGGATTFGGTLSAGGGAIATVYNGAGGVGGAVTGLGTGIAVPGGSGTGSGLVAGFGSGPGGGNSAFGGGGGGGTSSASGLAGATGSGGGGGGGGAGASGVNVGAAGGAGGYVEALLTGSALLSTFTYSVGAAGNAGTAGTSGFAGGAGGSGYLQVEEYYQ